MKTTLILLLYDALIGGDGVSRKEFCAQMAVSGRTFYRYMREVSDFVYRYKHGYILDFDSGLGRYLLKKVPSDDDHCHTPVSENN